MARSMLPVAANQTAFYPVGPAFLSRRSGGQYTTTATIATIISVKAFNHSGLQSVSPLLTNGTEEISPTSLNCWYQS